MFFFKRKQIVLDAFTMSTAVYEYYPIEKSIKFLPEWWKSLPKSYSMLAPNGVEFDVSTMKRCSGFIDYYSSGIVLPLWTDVNLKVTEDSWLYQFSFDWSEGMENLKEKIQSHDSKQFGNAFDGYLHLKLSTPWVFKESKGIKFHFSQPTWNNMDNIHRMHTLPGVVDFKYQHTTAVNFVVPNTPDVFKLEAGYPLVYLVPLSEEDIVVKNHHVSKEEYNKIFLRGAPTSFQKIYSKHKSISRAKESKCPFGFN